MLQKVAFENFSNWFNQLFDEELLLASSGILFTLTLDAYNIVAKYDPINQKQSRECFHQFLLVFLALKSLKDTIST